MRKIEENITGLIFLFIAFFMFYQVVSRYLLHHTLSYAEEIVRYLFIWASMLGISAAYRNDSHLSVNLLPQKIREKYGKVFQRIILFGTVLFFITLIYHGILSVNLQWKTHQTSSALGWPIIWVSLSIPIGAFLSLISVLFQKKSNINTDSD